MAKVLKEIQLGDFTITLKEDDQGQYTARLTSGSSGGLLEIEKLSDDSLRIRDLDIGSAEVLTEHLALMLVLIKADQNLTDEIHKIYKNREELKG
ncbi:hypothetical protein JOD43_000558 [Pullulanibacillus pueri]|uniref:Uncharacterized protein n=1 Tax=Pullulanibacillus pueri TaxID=1437324 RepID=A0A8J2ZSL8_9BACL|nr:hypothetical protein [Pullulanibacillus pueri]MBM7680399.1 hypothetical protein [Pullulanibacillus pueri]GGH75257.1 hypothetical protein GCM10007096_04310 [Pullulanibacillus pueri]